MKRPISLLLSVSMLVSSVAPCWSQAPAGAAAPPAPALSHAACSERGVREADHVGTGGAFTVGLVSGLGLGLIGTALAWGLQARPQPPAETQESLDNAECRLAYRNAYASAGQGKKRRAALIGGLIGTTVVVVAVAASGGAGE
uniref:Uncharacterized protein n=1 Tax=Eiseniibacteriota bacterium TaxID=2212470 RepID=A0A832IC02_UNCEI